jgi:hypothetical protein
MDEGLKYTLKALEGDLIRGIFKPLREQITEVRLHRVESFGIWIESQKFMDEVLRLHGKTSAPETIVIFLPWTEVKLILAGVDIPVISETAFQPQ